MELNTRGRYAVMAMADIAKFGHGEAVALSQIGERQKLSLAYLEQIFAHLRQAGLVESVRGRGGGYRLARPADEIAVADVMAAVAEETRMTRCSASDLPGGCLGESRCLTHGLWHALGTHIHAFLSAVTLKDVIDGASLQQAARLAREPETTGLAAE